MGKDNCSVFVGKDGEGLISPSDFISPEELFQELIKNIRKYHPSSDISLIEKAFHIANNAHKGQLRKSGEPFVIHPLCVSIILADLRLDKEAIIAGLLHDVVEDTIMTVDEIKEIFGEEVALLVDGVTKLTRISRTLDKTEEQAENLRKMFLAMAKDIRVLLIKLADRLHNLRTLQYMPEHKQKEIARETLDIYAPLAHRLGIAKIKVELDDLGLKYMAPDVYEEIIKDVNLKKLELADHFKEIIGDMKAHFREAGIHAEVYGRVKHFFKIYKKMITQNKSTDQVDDIFAIRILVDDIKDCYTALGVIHEMYTPIPGRFKDYIAMPKPNRYQALHTALMTDQGHALEIQIRAIDMNQVAEYGITAHWRYKEGDEGASLEQEEAKLNWLKQILEWQRELSDNKEFLNLLKNDLNLFSDNVYCFTPKGEVKTLPIGSNCIDFGYMIHSAVGNRMVGARVNGGLVPLDYTLQNGDLIDIITSQNSPGPSRDWIDIVRTTNAKSKINQWFKTQYKDDDIFRGREMLKQYAMQRKIDLEKIDKPKLRERVLSKYQYRDWDSILAAVGHGGLKESQITNKLQEEYDRQMKKEVHPNKELEEAAKVKKGFGVRQDSNILVQGKEDMAVRISKCCSPVPGDEIIGFLTVGRGISIHRTDCINIMNIHEHERHRLVEAEWKTTEECCSCKVKYTTEIIMEGDNRIGMLAEISEIFSMNQIDILSMNVRTSKKGKAIISIEFETAGIEALTGLSSQLMKVEGIEKIQRSMG